MSKLKSIKHLKAWEHAKECIVATLGNSGWGCNGKEWPQRMGFDLLAILQAMGDESETEAWKTALVDSDIPTHTDHEVVCLPFSAKIVEYRTINPTDFATFLHDQQEQPSKHIQAWFEAYGLIVPCEAHDPNHTGNPEHISTIHHDESKPLEIDAKPSTKKVNIEKRASQLHDLIWRVYLALKNQSSKRIKAQDVWLEIQHRRIQYDTDEIIQEVTGKKILWKSAYGHEQNFVRSSLDPLLSDLKRKHAI